MLEGVPMRRLILFPAIIAAALIATAQPRPMFQRPTVSATQIAFVYAGRMSTVGPAGGVAQRLTSGAGVETRPYFSPDGKEIAFTGEYDGNVDIFTIPAAGGVPKRITWHPSADNSQGWTPDGKHILFSSNRLSYAGFTRLFTVAREGGFPSELPLPIGEEGSFSPDGSQIAYVPLNHAFHMWKHYRGGRASMIWIARLSDSSVQPVPRKDSNDFNPMWVDDRVFF